jgi:hypothetical protein
MSKKPLVEKLGKKYPCPLHPYEEAEKTYDSETGEYLVRCPVCGIIGRFKK